MATLNPSVSQQVTFESLDACAEAMTLRNVDVELLQLGPGSGQVSVRTTPCRLLSIQRIRIDAPAIRRGSLDPSKLHFAVWDERRPQEGAWCGTPMGAAGVSVFPHEFSATGQHRLDGTVVEVEHARCLEVASLLEVDSPSVWSSKSVIQPLAGSSLNRLTQNLMALESGERDPGREWEVLESLFRACGSLTPKRPRASLRAGVFAAARDHIRACAQDIPTVPELCKATDVSLRTLEYAFRERVGMTPVQYLKIYRLNQVRRMLRQGETSTVVDAANTWGFWHMGKLAGDYRQVFGVTPSSDLRR